MYERHFGLKRRPFASVPCAEEYFPAEVMAAAQSTLTRCIQRAEGTGLVVGPSGTGKTLMCQLLLEHFQHELAVAIVSSIGVSTRRTLLQAILYELGRPYRGMDEGELRLALVDYLTADEDHPPAMLLVIDDAQTLPIRLLDEIRMLASLASDGQPRTRLVLAGSPLLEEQLACPKLESFSQRIVARCYLEPLGRAETAQYVQSQIVAAGGAEESVFSPDACLAVYKATDGVPRLINQLCDHAMLLAYAGGKRRIGADGVEEAWTDLQQLPAPCRADETSAGSPVDVIEFGQLADDSDADVSPVCGTIEPSLRLTPGPEISFDEPAAGPAKSDLMLTDQDDFQPAGSIEPEVELVFDSCVNPFGEPFQEETPVVDRYHSARKSGKARPPIRMEPTAGLMKPKPDTSDGLQTQADPAATVEFGALDDDPYPSDEMILVEDSYDAAEPPHVPKVAVVRPHEYGQLFARLRRGG